MAYTPDEKKFWFTDKAHELYLKKMDKNREGIKQVKITVKEVDTNLTPMPTPTQEDRSLNQRDSGYGESLMSTPTLESVSPDAPYSEEAPLSSFSMSSRLSDSVSEPRRSAPQPVEVKLDPLILVHIDPYQFEGIISGMEAPDVYNDLKSFFDSSLQEALTYPNYSNLFIKFGKRDVVGDGNNMMQTINRVTGSLSGTLVQNNNNRWGTGTAFNFRWAIQELIRAYYETINVNDVYESSFKKLNSIIIIYSASSSFKVNKTIDGLERTLNEKKFLLSSAQGFGVGDPNENLEAAVYKPKAPIQDIKFLYLIEVTDQDDHIKPATSGETSNFQWRSEHYKIGSPIKLTLPVNGTLHRHSRLEKELANSNLLVTQTLS
tara:strand:- start:32606 stop:33733 length:1128 start_codon:yes stop_codon:yes gene_type:complete